MRYCECPHPLPREAEGVLYCGRTGCGEVLLPPELAELEERLRRKLQPSTPERQLSIKECADLAGYARDYFRKIRNRFGFQKGARFVAESTFYSALESRTRGKR